MQITLFFTYGVGLTTWEQRGLFSREVGYYRALVGDIVKTVVFVTYQPQDTQFVSALAKDGIVVCVRPSWIPKFLFSLVSPFLFWSTMKQTTIFKTNQMSGSWSGVIAKLLWRKPLVVRTGYTWSDFQKQLQKSLRVWVARTVEFISCFCADAIIVTTVAQKTLLPLRQQSVVHVIPNYIDTDLFSPVGGQSMRVDQPFHIITVGRLSAQKNIFFLIDCVKQMPHTTLTIVGDGELRGELEQYTVGLEEKVRFTGIVSNDTLPQLLRTADIFVSTSHFDGNPKTILEAMSCGLPIVAQSAPGVSDIIVDGVTGFLCQASVGSFVENISLVMRQSDLAARVGMGARAWVVERQSISSVIQKELDLYSQYIIV